jgi:hypothetical protein
MLNAALAAEDRTVPQHVDRDPFHFDYVDSDDPNALAFCCDDYLFIGVRTALLNVLWKFRQLIGRISGHCWRPRRAVAGR